MNLRTLALSVCAALACLAGCTTSTNSGVGGTTSSGTTGGGGTTSSSSTTSGGGTCASTCIDTGYCNYQYAACGPTHSEWITDEGTCQPRPDTCTGLYEPVCGCDGKAYPSECSAHAAGVDTGHSACAPAVTPEGYFPCGPLYCNPVGDYCDVMMGDTGDTSWSCKPLPATCDGVTPADCACLGAPQSPSQCTVVQGNGVTGLQSAWSPG